jgi:hypothetical protein
MPYLLDHELSAENYISAFGVKDNIADIVAKRLFKVGGFGVKD